MVQNSKQLANTAKTKKKNSPNGEKVNNEEKKGPQHSIRSKTIKNNQKGSKMIKNGQKGLKRSKRSITVKNGQYRSKIVKNGQKWSKMINI